MQILEFSMLIKKYTSLINTKQGDIHHDFFKMKELRNSYLCYKVKK